MVQLKDVTIAPLQFERFVEILDAEHYEELQNIAAAAQELLGGRIVWNVNSTATGGGVAEMLSSLLAYARGVGVDTRWLVIEGDPEFFRVTKRIHNGLHGMPGDGGPLDQPEHAAYESTLRANAEELRVHLRPGDIVMLHDPQTAGLVDVVRDCGAVAIWRCHVGHDETNLLVERTWEFLRRYLEAADAYVFSRRAYAPDWLDHGRMSIIPPSIDPFSPKNQEMSSPVVRSILAHVGIIARNAFETTPLFVRGDGSPGRVDHFADVVRAGHSPLLEVPLVVQVSRWDRLKDMQGVLEGFADFVDGVADAHLALVGPNVTSVADDPEGGEVLEECITAWRKLPHAERSRIQLVCLPMSDVEENAAIVNALQRHAAVVVQKSLHEGFGLTVSEAMWKARPIVASPVGGIQDQIVDGEHGLLVDPGDLESFGAAVRCLLTDDELARRLGENARRRAKEQFLGTRHLIQYAELFTKLLAGAPGSVQGIR